MYSSATNSQTAITTADAAAGRVARRQVHHSSKLRFCIVVENAGAAGAANGAVRCYNRSTASAELMYVLADSVTQSYAHQLQNKRARTYPNEARPANKQPPLLLPGTGKDFQDFCGLRTLIRIYGMTTNFLQCMPTLSDCRPSRRTPSFTVRFCYILLLVPSTNACMPWRSPYRRLSNP